MKIGNARIAFFAVVLLAAGLVVYQMRDRQGQGDSSAWVSAKAPAEQNPRPASVEAGASKTSAVPVVAAAVTNAIPVDETFKRFDEWAGRYHAAGKPDDAQLLDEGVALAKERREAFRKLIRANPKEAVERALSDEALVAMPDAVGMYLERHVRGGANSSMFSPGGIEHYTDNYRELMVRGETLNSYVYGNRAEQLLFRNTDIHGVAVGPDMAVEDAAQIPEDLLASENLPAKVTEGVVKATVEFNEADLLFSQEKGYDVVNLKEGNLRNDQAGKPWLPTRSAKVLLPAGARVQSVTATAGEEALLRSGVNLIPVQPPVPLLEGVTAEFVEPDPEAYASTRKFPSSLVDGNAAGRRKGWTTVAVLVNPVRYIPASRDLYLARRVEISVSYELPPVPPVVFAGQKAAEEKDTTSHVVNPEQAGATPYYVGRGDWSAEAWLSGADVEAAEPLDGDAEPLLNEKISLSSATYAISESGGNLMVTVTISRAPTVTATVDYLTANGSAQAGFDYTATSGTLTWQAGDGLSKTFQVPIIDDLLQEGAETFTVTLSNVTGGTTLNTATATVTINDNDTPGTFQFVESSYDVMENGTTVSLTVERVNGASGAVSVNYATANGTATAGQDYTAASGTLNFVHGEISKDLSFTILNDTNYEGSVESFTVVLSNPTGGAVLGSPATAAVTISDDDPMPGAVDYLIITSASLAGGCGALQVHRQTFNGFQVEIRDTTWINANYSGAKPAGGTDTQTSIQNLIKDYVATRGLQYVCIVGDNSVVDDRNCRIVVGSYTENSMPTDLYWAGLDSSWDENANGAYGEGGEGDLNYDVLVGRIPVRTTSHINSYVNKMIKYETNPPQDLCGKFLMGGNKAWDSYTDTSRPADLVNDGHVQFRDPSHTTVHDTEIWGRRAYRDFVQPNGWQADKIGCLFASLKTSGISRNEGWNFVNHFAHGNYTSTSDGGGTFSTSTASSMTGLIAFWHTCACQTGGFDAAEPSLSEAAIRNPIGGAIVYIGCSRYGWGSAGSYYGSYSADYQRYWLEALFRDERIISGQAFHEMKQRLAGSSTYDNAMRWIQLGLNFQGDPAVMIHGIKPVVSVKVVESLAAEPGTDTASICFERTGSVSNSLSVSYTRSGSAAAPGDFSTTPATASSGSITIPAGTNRVVVTLTAANDSTVENDETVLFTISTSADYLINSAYSAATMTILDNDNSVTPVVALAVQDASAAEQNSDPGMLRITRSGSVSTSISVNYTLSGTASAADYSETLSGYVTLAAGVASIDIPVTPIDDILPESDETLDVTLTSGTGYTLSSAVSGIINIVDNEPRPPVTISAVDDRAAENTADTATLRFMREGNTDLPLSVDYLLSGTASAADYSPALTGSVTIPSGTNSVDLVLTAVDDSEHELWETLVVDVVPGAGYYNVGSPSQATIWIQDDDNMPPAASAGADQVVALVLGGTPPSVSGAHIVLDAGLDDGANAVWEDSLNKWNLSINTGVTFVPDAGSHLPGITSAYDFPGGTAGAGGCDGASLQDMSVDTDPITLELWFKPDASASYPANGQVLWETGGTIGMGIFYRNGFVEVGHDDNQGQISADVSALTNEFIQVVVTYDTGSSSNNFMLYVNGQLKATGSRSDSDLCGGDGAGLGNRGGSNTGGAGSVDANTESFNGKIAIFRAYHGRALDAAEVHRNYSSVAAYGSAEAVLAGTASDPEGDQIVTTWSLVNGPTAVSFSDASATNATVTFSLPGSYTLRLTADDGAAQDADDVVITVKSPPVADAGAEQTVSDTDANGSESITLNGTGSHDPDGLIVSYVWKEGATQIATGVTPTVILSSGTHTLTLTVTDNEGRIGQDTVVIRVSSSPIIANAGGVSVSETTASLRGILSGGAAADAWICWGVTDGGTASTGGWQHVVSVGGVAEGVAFSNLVTGLSTNTTYYYRCYASNSVGTAWSYTAETFSGTPVIGYWTPASIAPVAWYDAEDSGTITESSGVVSQWSDKSGNGNHLSANGDPNTGIRTINGVNAIDFDGSGDEFIDSSFTSLNTSNVSIFAVQQYDTITVQSMTAWTMERTTDTEGMMLHSSYDSVFSLGQRYPENTSVGYTENKNIELISYVKSGTTAQRGWVAGVSIGTQTGPVTTFAAQKLALGSRSGGNYLDGAIGEFIVVPAALSDVDRQKLEGYLAWKWGVVTNLPVGHPYKVASPGGVCAIANLAPAGISASSATFNASLNASGTNYDVYVCCGTSDGGTNVGSWGSSAFVGSWTHVLTNVSYAASGLMASQKYYYTFMTSNATGRALASPSWTFTTPNTPTGTIVVKPATGIVTTSAVLNGEWQNATGTVYDIDVFWGEVDAGTSAGLWANTANVGTFTNDVTPAFSRSISGLNPGTTYSYAFRATNTTDTIWTTPRGTFVTVSAPVVNTTQGAAATSTTTATLYGRMTKGGTANAWFCWGRTDGGTASTSAWDHVVSPGTVSEGVAFSNLVTGLSINTTYFYRCYAENPYGSDWSDPAEAFSGKPVGSGGDSDQVVTAGPSSKDVIVGQAESTPKPGYYPDNGGVFVGTGGSSGIRTDAQVVLGYMLPTLSAGMTVTNAEFNFEIISGRDNNNLNSELHVYLLNTANPDASGTNFFYHGVSNTTASAKYVGSKYIDIGTAHVDYPDDQYDVNFTLRGEALTLLQGFYGSDGVPTQPEVFFRFNLSVDPPVATYNRYGVDVADDESWLVLGVQDRAVVGNQAPTGISDAGATFKAALNASDTNYAVTVYYGTTDGGTNAGLWASSTFVGSWANVSTNISYAVSSLLGGTTYHYTFMASNEMGVVWASPSWTFTTPGIPGANHAPVAHAQSVTTSKDTVTAITLTGSDADNDPLTYTVVTQPAHGTLSGTAPSVTYTPAANYNGADSFTFKVNDGIVDSAPATVSITVTAVNNAPVASAGADQTVTLSGSAPVAWTPTNITLAAWYDAADATTVETSGSSVTNWLDKSGNNRRATQATATYQPTYTSNAINGLSAISWDGGDRMVSTLSASSASETIMAVVRVSEVSRTFLGSSGSGGRQFREELDSQLGFIRQNLVNLATSGTGNTIPTNTTCIVELTYNSTTSTFYFNGGAFGTPVSVNPGLTSGRTTTIGYNGYSNNEHFTGLMGEIVVCQSVLSTADRQKLEGYLAHKWGMTNSLPAGHPYKSAAPVNGTVATAVATLSGSASDPDNDPLTTTWSVVSTVPAGLAAPTFADAAATNTTATFTQAGQYTLRLTANDGTVAVSNEVVITVTDGGQSHVLTVTAGANGTITPNGAVTVTDGASQAFTIAPASHYAIASVRTNGTNVTIANPAGFIYTWNNVRAAGTLDASFVRAKTIIKAVPTEWLATAVPASTNDYEAAAMDDPDGDGFSTWEEYWSGTDPVNSNSFLRIDSVTLEGGNAVLKWQHAAVDPGLPPLAIQTTTNLQSDPWVYTGEKAPVNGTNTWSGSFMSPQLFYRLAVTNAP